MVGRAAGDFAMRNQDIIVVSKDGLTVDADYALITRAGALVKSSEWGAVPGDPYELPVASLGSLGHGPSREAS